MLGIFHAIHTERDEAAPQNKPGGDSKESQSAHFNMQQQQQQNLVCKSNLKDHSKYK